MATLRFPKLPGRVLTCVVSLALLGVATAAAQGPTKREGPPGNIVGAMAANAKVDINNATQAELQTLRGIGPLTARKIIANRPYASVDELRRAEVPGLIIDLIRPRVIAGSPWTRTHPSASPPDTSSPPKGSTRTPSSR